MSKKPPEVVVTKADFVLSLPNWKIGGMEPLPEICIAGRSNVGKSSLINAVVNRRGLAKTSSTPGRTQALVVFRIGLRLVDVTTEFHAIDLPGYGYAKVPLEMKAAWRPMMESYFMGNARLRCCVMLLDIRRDPGAADAELLEMLNLAGTRVLPVVTKADKISKTQRPKALKGIAEALGLSRDALRVTSVDEGLGINELRAELFEIMK